MEPLKKSDDAIILEFKVYDPDDGGTLQDTVLAALKQIMDKKYEQVLYEKGFPQSVFVNMDLRLKGKRF